LVVAVKRRRRVMIERKGFLLGRTSPPAPLHMERGEESDSIKCPTEFIL
jgi:hypothetical protein